MRERIENDTMGEVRVPGNALFGAQTQRAIENFPVSGLTLPRRFIRAQGIIKLAAARANSGLGVLPKKLARAMERELGGVRRVIPVSSARPMNSPG